MQTSGKQKGDGPADYSHLIEVSNGDNGGQSVTNIDYERREQDKKRQIKILLPSYLGVFEQEFKKLIRR